MWVYGALRVEASFKQNVNDSLHFAPIRNPHMKTSREGALRCRRHRSVQGAYKVQKVLY